MNFFDEIGKVEVKLEVEFERIGWEELVGFEQ